MRKILFIFAAVLLVACSGNDDAEEDTRIPLLIEIPTEYNFRGSDFSDEYTDKVVPFTYPMQVGDKVYFFIIILEVNPTIPPSTYANYPLISSVATLNADGNWVYDPPILLPPETAEIRVSSIYCGSDEPKNQLVPGVPLFTDSYSNSHKISKEQAKGVTLQLTFFCNNARMFFTGVGMGKKIWFSGAWRKNTVQVNSENGKKTYAYDTLQPNYINTDINGDAAIYANYSHPSSGLYIAITDVDALEPDTDDAIWHKLTDMWGNPLTGLFNSAWYNYVVDCSEIAK